MPISFEKIGQYLHYLSEVHGVQFCIKDFCGFVAINKQLDETLCPFLAHTNPFCMYMKSDQEHYHTCLTMIRRMYHKCERLGRTYFGMCHAGLGEYVVPIFDGEGVSEKLKTTGNANGMEVTLELAQRGFSGLAFVNLVDFDMVYGHRNDVDGYANAATEFDGQLAKLLPLLRAEDLLIITADHGCDPATPSTDHSREYVPMLAYGKGVRAGADLGTRRSFACIAQTVCEYLGVPVQLDGKSFLKEILR